MLEILVGNVIIQKLWAILLLEANFNVMRKIMLNNRLLPSAEMVDAILIEVIGERRSQLAVHLVLNKN